MKIKNKLQISKKTNIYVAISYFLIDMFSFNLMYQVSSYILYIDSELRGVMNIYAVAFVLVLLLIGGYSKNTVNSVSRNFKLIAVTTISMPFAFNLLLYQLGISNIASSSFINLLYVSLQF